MHLPLAEAFLAPLRMGCSSLFLRPPNLGPWPRFLGGLRPGAMRRLLALGLGGAMYQALLDLDLGGFWLKPTKGRF